MDDNPLSKFPPSFPTSFFDENNIPTFLTSFTTKKSSSTNTYDTFTSSQTAPALSTLTSYAPSSVAPASYPTPTGFPDNNDNNSFFDRLEGGTKAAMGIAITIGVIIIVALSVWYCCGCCGLRAKRRKRREDSRAPDMNTQRPVPLNTINSDPAAHPPGGDAPPQYEEAVPPQHLHIAGGARHVRQEEDDAVISDGKTPLSEIPFEDVVLDHSLSEGSSRSFSERHHGLGGDTSGHTNT